MGFSGRKSKWTKAAIFDSIEADAETLKVLKAIDLDTLQREFLTRSSYHHTSKFYNKTNFFAFNFNADPKEVAARNITTGEKETWRVSFWDLVSGKGFQTVEHTGEIQGAWFRFSENDNPQKVNINNGLLDFKKIERIG